MSLVCSYSLLFLCFCNNNLSSRLKILPDAFLGMSSRKMTPPLKRFAGDTWKKGHLIALG